MPTYAEDLETVREMARKELLSQLDDHAWESFVYDEDQWSDEQERLS